MKKSYKILIADDSELSYRIVSEILEIVGIGFDITYVTNGLEALETTLKIMPDLILMDLIMPKMNGIDAVKKIRENPLTKDIPIFMLSSTENLEASFAAGANDYISKPFNKYELLIKVRSAFNLLNKLEEIKVQKVELEKKNHELIKQRDQIFEQKRDIIDDIKYSKRIQKAILPTEEATSSALKEYFVLDMPKSIVSGDFYWLGEIQGKKIVAVADCTGHGISGAFMTMAGIAFLNQIVSKKLSLSANEILFELRVLIMNLLKQKGEEGEASDGMDIALVIIDEQNKTIEFAGANNPFYLIKEGQLEIYKGDRMPIGIHLFFKRPFTNHLINYNEGDIIYLFSDGYADQFGGPKNKKYRYRQFQEYLYEIHRLPMPEQKERLMEEITNWKGKNEQVDDIIVLGFKL